MILSMERSKKSIQCFKLSIATKTFCLSRKRESFVNTWNTKNKKAEVQIESILLKWNYLWRWKSLNKCSSKCIIISTDKDLVTSPLKRGQCWGDKIGRKQLLKFFLLISFIVASKSPRYHSRLQMMMGEKWTVYFQRNQLLTACMHILKYNLRSFIHACNHRQQHQLPST